MKILFVSAILPYPLYSGGQIRIYQLLRELSKRHEITLISFIRNQNERTLVSNLKFCKRVYMIHRGHAWQPKYIARALFGRYPFLLATYENNRAMSLIKKLVAEEKFDLIHAEPFYVWPSVPKHSVPIVVSEHNIEYAVYERYVDKFRISMFRPFLSWDVGKLYRWERVAWRNAQAITAVSPTDGRIIENYLGHDVAVVPNGVDLSMFTFQKPPEFTRKRAIFVGNFTWLPNREAADELLRHIWPVILNHHRDAHLTIAGRHIPAGLKALAVDAGVTIIEDADNIVDIYHDADVLLAPHEISGGTKYKILEAMASGLPVVTSPHGVAGIAAEPDVHFIEARTINEYEQAVTRIWDDAELRKSVAINARKLIESQYTWDSIANVLNEVWKKAAHEKVRY